MKVELEIEGIREMERELARLSDQVRERLILDALLAAGEVIRGEAQARAPHRTGTLRQSLQVEPGARHSPSVRVGLGRKGWYGRMIELGTGQRMTKTRGGRGRVTARPFLRPAMESRRQEAQDRARQVLRQGLNIRG